MLRRISLFCLATLMAADAAGAQRVDAVALGVSRTPPSDSVTSVEITDSPKPRWMKAAAIGAVAGGLAFGALHWMAGDYSQQTMGADVMIGAAFVGVTAGASVAFYDWVCAPGSASERAGLCGALLAHATRDDDASSGVGMRRR